MIVHSEITRFMVAGWARCPDKLPEAVSDEVSLPKVPTVAAHGIFHHFSRVTADPSEHGARVECDDAQMSVFVLT